MMTRAIRRQVRHATEANITFLGALLRRFPEWAIWMPRQGQWTAVHVRYGFLPYPHAALFWVRAAAARQLCAEVKRAERQPDAELRERSRRPSRIAGPS